MKDILLTYQNKEQDQKINPESTARHNILHPSFKQRLRFCSWVVSLWRKVFKSITHSSSKKPLHHINNPKADTEAKLLKQGGTQNMDGLKVFLAELEAKKAQVENQDIESYVQAKLAELAPKIRAEAQESQAYESKVLGIKIEAVREALTIVEAEKVAATEQAVTAVAETAVVG